ncbi:MAG TPA: sugar porter family MFS transporter [Hanamia sp.]|nr:sugar porter family MFS transporter [Hanamia sp.]
MQNKAKAKVLLMSMIAATGGLLFGFDTGVISGALPYLKEYWTLSDTSLEWLTTAVLIGAVIGAITSGKLSDYLGRKKMIIINAFIFIVGALGCGLAKSFQFLIVMRIIVGIAIGITSYVVPMYIAEISPAAKRGALVTLNQLMITIGLLVSYMTDYLFSNNNNLASWRWMFIVGLLPGVVLFIGMFFVPETPRWLISKNFLEKGKEILESIEDPAISEITYDELIKDNDSASDQRSELKEIFKPWLRAPLIITVGIFFFMQFSGVNTIIYYSPIIFQKAGIIGNSASIIPSIVIGVFNVLACVVSIFLLDKIGRRKLFMIGMIGMVPSLAITGICFIFKTELGDSLIYLSVISIVCYIIFINISLSPLGWLLISEIFPIKVRGVGMSIGSLSHWGFNAIVALSFLSIVNRIGIGWTFCIYAIICFIGLIWGYFYIPETKGKTLEQIEKHWRQGKSPRSL